jgi:hypothetical protein
MSVVTVSPRRGKPCLDLVVSELFRQQKMDPKTHEILHSADDARGAEVPGGDRATFPWQELADSIRSVQRSLERELGLAFQNDGQVQDASYHDDLYIPCPNSRHRHPEEIVLRFSNFGRLYTVFSGLPQIPQTYPVDNIREIVERHGWQHAPHGALDEPYDGVNDLFRDGETTWWIRFFDFL